jgi:hypothetical protein
MSAYIDQIAIGYIESAKQQPAQAVAIYRDAARTLAAHAAEANNAGLAPALLGWATRFAEAAERPATVIDFLDFLEERAEAYRQVGSPYDDMDVIARHAEIHEERTPGLPRVSITPKSVTMSTRLGDQATIKWDPTEADKLAGIKRTNTLVQWQGTKEESQAITIDTAILDQPQTENVTGGPRPYSIISFGADGAKVDVEADIGQRITVVGSYVGILVGMNPPRSTDFTKGQITVGASIGFFAAPSVAPVICTRYIDNLDVGVTQRIVRPTKAMYLQPMQSNLQSGTATLTFYALDGSVPQYVVDYINSAQNVPIPLTADIYFIDVTNTGGGAANFRLPFQLSL